MDVPRKRTSHIGRWLMVAVASVALLGAVTVGLRQKANALPAVEKNSVLVDTVTQGSMLREIEAPGVLEADGVLWLSASTAGRVENLAKKAGDQVVSTDVVIVLSNPDIELAAIEAELLQASTKADVARLQAEVSTLKSSHAASAQAFSTQQNEAKTRAETASALAKEGLIDSSELLQWQTRSEELSIRAKHELERLQNGPKERAAELSAKREQQEIQGRLARFRKAQIEGLAIRAGIDGEVLVTLVEAGQWVPAGTALAKVAPKNSLKVALSVGEVQARDVAPGQIVRIDTHSGVVRGHVVTVEPASKGGSVRVEVRVDEPMPKGARPDLRVDATIEVEKLENVLMMRRPAGAPRTGGWVVYRVDSRGVMTRVVTQLSAGTASHAVVTEGLQKGDRVVVSDVTHLQSAQQWQLAQ